MNGLIDYAGLFPPAALELDEAITNYASYRTSEYAEMLSCFIIPSSRLTELDAYSHLFSQKPPFVFSVLGGNPTGMDAYKKSIQTLVEQSTAFVNKHGKNVVISVFEIKLPELSGEKAFGQVLNETIQTLSDAGFTDSQLFFEPVRNENWNQTCEALTNALKKASIQKSAGFKLRCGGISADLFPSIAEVAEAIYRTSSNGIALKATAGLHHPIRHFSKDVNTKMHGFFNVFGATILAGAHQLNQTQITDILEDENPANFHFDDKRFAWKDFSIQLNELVNLRNQLATSYGSCSFDEPLDDLKALNLL